MPEKSQINEYSDLYIASKYIFMLRSITDMHILTISKVSTSLNDSCQGARSAEDFSTAFT